MNGDWGPFAVAFLVAGALGGLVVILVGLFGSDLTAGGWADATSSDEAALIVMVVAMPLHFVLRRFYERRWRAQPAPAQWLRAYPWISARIIPSTVASRRSSSCSTSSTSAA